MLHRPALMALIPSLSLFFLCRALASCYVEPFLEAFKRSKHAMPLHFGCRVLKCMQGRNRSSEFKNIMSQHDTCLDVATYKRAWPIPFEMIWYSFHLVDGWQGLEWLYFNRKTTTTQNTLQNETHDMYQENYANYNHTSSAINRKSVALASFHLMTRPDMRCMH